MQEGVLCELIQAAVQCKGGKDLQHPNPDSIAVAVSRRGSLEQPHRPGGVIQADAPAVAPLDELLEHKVAKEAGADHPQVRCRHMRRSASLDSW